MGLVGLVDLDSTVNDMHRAWLALYNRRYGDDLTIADLTHWDMTRYVKPECDARVYDLFGHVGFFLDLPELDGAVDALRELHEAGHLLYVMSDCFHDCAAAEKRVWCREHLPFIPMDRVVMGAPKHLLRADFLVDDSPGQVRRYREAWGAVPLTCSIAYPYNVCVADLLDVRAEGWQDPRAAWREVVRAVAFRDLELPPVLRVPQLAGSAAQDSAGFRR